MAFLKYANANLVKPDISMDGWGDLCSQAVAVGSSFRNRGASHAVREQYQPSQHMLSHCTIVASVDTENAGMPSGRQVVDGFQVDRRWDDFFITPNTSRFVNNNRDCFERKLLLSTFRTFIGAQNFCEHLQLPELSKGRIIDAAARDIGDSVYIDILVATDLKHKPLISAIQSGQLRTLSMGATVAHTTCSMCGNVAEDETLLCKHVRYMKGNTFVDPLGKKRMVAELCGHHTEKSSVRFIEASWVANPAFTGAVVRNILSPTEAALFSNRVQVAFSQPAPAASIDSWLKAARQEGVRAQPIPVNSAFVLNREATLQAQGTIKSMFKNPTRSRTRLSFDFEQGQAFEGEKPSEPAKEDKDPLDGVVDEVVDVIREKALKKIRQDLRQQEMPPSADLQENQNNTLIKEASRDPVWQRVASEVLRDVRDRHLSKRILGALIMYKSGGWNGLRGKFTKAELLAVSRFVDRFNGASRHAGDDRVYRTVMAVGGLSAYENEQGYLAACRRVIGRELTGSEKGTLITKGRIYDLGL